MQAATQQVAIKLSKSQLLIYAGHLNHSNFLQRTRLNLEPSN